MRLLLVWFALSAAACGSSGAPPFGDEVPVDQGTPPAPAAPRADVRAPTASVDSAVEVAPWASVDAAPEPRQHPDASASDGGDEPRPDDGVSSPPDGGGPFRADGGDPAGPDGGGRTGPDAAPVTSADATRAAFRALVARPVVPLAPAVRPLPAANGLEREAVSFAADARHRVSALVVRKGPAGAGRRPAVIVLHTTGGKKEDELPLLETLAGRGLLAVAIDARHHGAGVPGSAYTDAIFRTYRTGEDRPFLYDTVWDVMRTIDLLATRADADAARVGLIGFSKGGMETYLAAAVEPRVAVAIPCIGVQSFRWALDNGAWRPRIATIQAAADAAARFDGVARIDAPFVRRFYDRVVPGI